MLYSIPSKLTSDSILTMMSSTDLSGFGFASIKIKQTLCKLTTLYVGSFYQAFVPLVVTLILLYAICCKITRA